MRSVPVSFVILVGACSFRPAHLSEGADGAAPDVAVVPDGPIADGPIADGPIADGPTADAPAADARPIDARPIDAAIPDAAIPDAARPDAAIPDAAIPDAAIPDAARPDAYVELCPAASATLPLATPTAGSLSGSGDTWPPTCGAGGHGPEQYWRVEVPPSASDPGPDLVLDVAETTSTLSTILSSTTMCSTTTSEGCVDVGGSGEGEVLVLPAAYAGTHYVVINSVYGSAGNYTIDAFTRPVVGDAAECDQKMLSSRCVDGEYCVDTDGNGKGECHGDLTPIAINANNPCAFQTPATVSGDSVLTGTAGFWSAAYVQLDVTAASSQVQIRATGTHAGCDADVTFQLYDQNSLCTGGTPIATDTNSGLGPCPTIVQTLAQGTYYLSVSGSGSFSVVVDYE